MKTYRLKTEQWFSQPLKEVFAFFADAHNLQTITPPWLHFSIVTPAPIDMREGTVIDYRLSLRHVPIRWQSEITVWQQPYHFVDKQRRGPYRLWVHEHHFIFHDGGTLVRDEVEYAVPGGALFHRIFVAPELRKIFDYRYRKLQHIFDTDPRRSRV